MHSSWIHSKQCLFLLPLQLQAHGYDLHFRFIHLLHCMQKPIGSDESVHAIFWGKMQEIMENAHPAYCRSAKHNNSQFVAGTKTVDLLFLCPKS